MILLVFFVGSQGLFWGYARESHLQEMPENAQRSVNLT